MSLYFYNNERYNLPDTLDAKFKSKYPEAIQGWLYEYNNEKFAFPDEDVANRFKQKYPESNLLSFPEQQKDEINVENIKSQLFKTDTELLSPQMLGETKRQYEQIEQEQLDIVKEKESDWSTLYKSPLLMIERLFGGKAKTVGAGFDVKSSKYQQMNLDDFIKEKRIEGYDPQNRFTVKQWQKLKDITVRDNKAISKILKIVGNTIDKIFPEDWQKQVQEDTTQNIKLKHILANPKATAVAVLGRVGTQVPLQAEILLARALGIAATTPVGLPVLGGFVAPIISMGMTEAGSFYEEGISELEKIRKEFPELDDKFDYEFRKALYENSLLHGAISGTVEYSGTMIGAGGQMLGISPTKEMTKEISNVLIRKTFQYITGVAGEGFEEILQEGSNILFMVSTMNQIAEKYPELENYVNKYKKELNTLMRLKTAGELGIETSAFMIAGGQLANKLFYPESPDNIVSDNDLELMKEVPTEIKEKPKPKKITPEMTTETENLKVAEGLEEKSKEVKVEKEETVTQRKGTTQKKSDLQEPAESKTTQEQKKVDIIATPDEIDYNIAYQAYSGTSFDPEIRAKSEQEDYANHINENYQKLKKLAKTDKQKELLDKEFVRYKEGYKKRFLDYLHSHSGLISTMISGPSNFPTSRMEKQNRIVDNKYKILSEYDEKAINSIKRKLGKQGIEDRGGELAVIEQRLSEQKKTHEMMKQANTILRKKNLSASEIQEKLSKIGFSEKAISSILKPNYMEYKGIMPFELSNSNAKIKRLQEKLNNLKSKNNLQGENPTVLFENNEVKIINNHEQERVQILFGGKPDSETIAKLKKNGYRWSPKNKAWQRKNTVNGVNNVIKLFGKTKQKQEQKVAEQPAEDKKKTKPEVEIKEAEDVSGKKHKYIEMSKAKGEKYFEKEGYIQQPNKNFWKKDNIYAHYNRYDKTWHIDEAKPKVAPKTEIAKPKVTEKVEEPEPKKFASAKTKPLEQSGKKQTKESVLHKASVPRRNTMPILSNMVVKNGYIFSTDLETTLKTKTDLPDGMYRFIGNNIEKSNDDIEQYPLIPDKKDVKAKTEIRGFFVNDIKRAIKSVSKDIQRPIFTGVLFSIKGNKLILKATDGKIITHNEIDISKKGKDGEYIVTAKGLKLILKDKSTNELEMKFAEDKTYITNGNIEIFTFNIEGKYPGTTRAFPKKINTQYVFDKNQLKSKLAELSPYTNEIGKVKIIREANGNIYLLVENRETGITKKVKLDVTEINKTGFVDTRNVSLLMPLKTEGKNIIKSFDIGKLQSTINNIKGDKVYLGTDNNLNTPAVFYGKDIIADKKTAKRIHSISINNEIDKLEKDWGINYHKDNYNDAVKIGNTKDIVYELNKFKEAQKDVRKKLDKLNKELEEIGEKPRELDILKIDLKKPAISESDKRILKIYGATNLPAEAQHKILTIDNFIKEQEKEFESLMESDKFDEAEKISKRIKKEKERIREIKKSSIPVKINVNKTITVENTQGKKVSLHSGEWFVKDKGDKVLLHDGKDITIEKTDLEDIDYTVLEKGEIKAGGLTPEQRDQKKKESKVGITDKQRKMLFGMNKKLGYDDKTRKKILKEATGVDSFTKLTQKTLNTYINRLNKEIGLLNALKMRKEIPTKESIKELEENKIQKTVTSEIGINKSKAKTAIRKSKDKFIKELNNRNSKRIKRVKEKDSKISSLMPLEESLNKLGVDVIRQYHDIYNHYRDIERKGIEFNKKFNKNVIKKLRKAGWKLVVVDDWKNKKFTKKVMDYIESGKSANKYVKIVGDEYLKANKDLHKYIRATRVFLYNYFKDNDYIKFAKKDNEIEEINKLVETFENMLDSNEYDVAVDKYIQEADKYDWGVREKYIPTQHEQTDEEAMGRFIERGKFVSTRQYKSGEGEKDIERFWSSFENAISNGLTIMKLAPRLTEFKKMLSPKNQRALEPFFNTIFRQGKPSPVTRFLGSTFSLTYTGFLFSPYGWVAHIRNLNQNIARHYFVPKRFIISGVRDILKNPSSVFKKIELLNKEEKEIMEIVSSKISIMDAYLLTTTVFSEVPILRTYETIAKQAAETYIYTDIMNRYFLMKYLMQAKNYINDYNGKNAETIMRRLKLGNNDNTSKLYFAELLEQDKMKALKEYIRLKILDIHHDYSRIGRPAFMQNELTKVLSGLLIYPTSSTSKAFRQVKIIGSDVKGWERLQAAETLAMQTYSAWYKTIIKGIIGGLIGLGLLGKPPEEERVKKIFVQYKTKKVMDSIGWLIAGEMANRNIKAITGKDYGKYGLGEIYFGSPALVSTYENIKEGVNDFYRMTQGEIKIEDYAEQFEKNFIQKMPFISLSTQTFLALHDMKAGSVSKDIIKPLLKSGAIPNKEQLVEIDKYLDKNKISKSMNRYYRNHIKEMKPLKVIQTVLFGRESSLKKTRENVINARMMELLARKLKDYYSGKEAEKYEKEEEYWHNIYEKERLKVPLTAKKYSRGSLYKPTSETIAKRFQYNIDKLKEKEEEIYDDVLSPKD